MLGSALVAVVATLGGVEARAWNYQGHQVVAEVAESYLSPDVRDRVDELLRSEGKTRLADIATWADEMRDLDRPRQPSHAIRLPLTNEHYVQERDCRNKNCILEAINADLAALKDGEKTVAARVAALKYLTHFIGDLHQPLHASIDTGQQNVIFEGKEMTLHGVWDRGLIQCQINNVRTLLETAPPFDRNDVNVVSWAEESRSIARDFIFPNFNKNTNQPVVLEETYCKKFSGIVVSQLQKAGRRLANLLNANVAKQK
ncbi:S1/P1 nuclease [Rhizobium sp. NFR07]|uniref:S1/P1 nuclease n=1 Tax=Rhizobium sp. NFR07 TaxID=1566262 RepID=UPI0015A5D78A|nr:S1/P1 nuclease [Rhizobium sp. NFR07]